MEKSDEFLDLPATTLACLVRSGDLSAREIVEASLHRIDRLNPRVNAVCTVSDRALADSDDLDRRLRTGEDAGALAGLPIGIKDLTETAGLRTTYGSRLYRDNIPDRDSVVVRRIREAGGIIIGKTNTPEFGAGANTKNELFGATRNPWNPRLTAGGSTGGGASALATGMVALAQGTDLGGSLRIPAAFCGVVGLRPTPGLIPTIPSAYLWDTLEVSGGLARTAGDLRLLIGAMAGPDPLCPLSHPPGLDRPGGSRGKPLSSIRIAYTPEIAGIGIEPALESVCRQAVGRLEDAVLEIREVPVDLGFARSSFAVLRGLWMAIQHRERLGRLGELNRHLAGNIEYGLQRCVEEIVRAEAGRSRVRCILMERLREYDFLLTPCTAVPAFPVEIDFPETVCGKKLDSYYDWFAPTFVLSLAGLPVGAVPCGLDGDGMPVGLQVVGSPGEDLGVLSVCGLVQKTSPVGLPDLGRLGANSREVRPSGPAA